MAAVKPAQKLTLRDRLSRLDFTQACKLLGQNGKDLLHRGAKIEIADPKQVRLNDDSFRLSIQELVDEPKFDVTIRLQDGTPHRLDWNCSGCTGPCEHVAAGLSYILENKTLLDLAVAPPEREPVPSLGEVELVEQALAERVERSKTEKMKVSTTDASKPWVDYVVTSLLSGKSYRVSLRGLERGASYCSCPDFRANTLGTCKHILHVAHKIRRKFDPKELKKPYRRRRITVLLKYGETVSLRLEAPDRVSDDVERIIGPLRGVDVSNPHDLLARLQKLDKLGQPFNVYPDAEEFIQQQLLQERLTDRMAAIRKDPKSHPLRTTLLKTPLLPYQLDGIAFVVGAGRAILADDMGLGKTIQGVGVAELLAREADIRKVLVVCPASLKSQWRNEINRFVDRSSQIVTGPTAERATQYQNDAFFTICNYEQVMRDLLAIEGVPWDLIILDEGQRIKNWEAKTTRVVKALKSRFALVLSGTPLENRLEELFSVVQFIDQRRLGPGFRFFNTHRLVDEKGKVLGYKNLDQIREHLKPILLRRTRDKVKLELPPRTTEIVRIAPTEEQSGLHDAHMRVVAAITRKKFLTEMDLLRLRMSLLMCRMAADHSVLVEKDNPPGHSSKLEHLRGLFDELFAEEGRKIIVFSEWTGMLDLIEPILQANDWHFVRLDGSVPQKKRQALVQEFQTDPDCKLFLTTNAGSTGLNLQAANTVINVDLPWNPAVLEQRIGRAHRMGQTQPVQVFVLVTEGTIEENLLATLNAKKNLAMAALDTDSDVDEVTMVSNLDDLRNKLEVLLGAKPAAPLDVTVQQQVEKDKEAYREKVATAGGELLGAAFNFLGQVLAQNQPQPPAPELVGALRKSLAGCVTENGSGQQQLTIALPNSEALNALADSLARLMQALPK